MGKIGISDFSGSKLYYFGGQPPLRIVSCLHASMPSAGSPPAGR